MTTPEVGMAAGVVRGSHEAGVAVFRGIPFAEAPVGELRFAAPQPVRAWDEVREAVSFGPPPPQPDALGRGEVSAAEVGDEWLTVNVWSPDPGPGARLPVMVWIHGGGYTVGMSSSPEYDGGRLARDGGVVVVTFNYRTGFEGFAQIAGAPSNRALLDQVAALEWVQGNIQAFGGDPGQVTVFGESSGAGSIAALLAMPRSTGLFRRAAVQSVPGTFFAPELAAEIAAACADTLGLRPTVAELGAVDPARLVAAGEAVAAAASERTQRWGQVAHRSIVYAPVVDGEVLPVVPWRALADGAGRDVELLVGHARDEQRLFSLLSGALGKVTDEQAAAALRVFAPGPDGERRYRDAFADAGAEQLYELVHADWLFRMPSLHLAEAQVAGGGQAHLFELTWPAPGMGGMLGACHGLFIPLIFGNLDRGQPAMLIGDSPSIEAEALSARMRAAWTTFTVHGDPGWAAYDTDKRVTQIFDARSVVAAYPEEASRLIWQDHTFAEAALIGQ